MDTLLSLPIAGGQEVYLRVASGAILYMQALYVEIGRDIQLPAWINGVPY
jgi:hypothetical protein